MATRWRDLLVHRPMAAVALAVGATQRRRGLHQTILPTETSGLLSLYHRKLIAGELKADCRQKRAAEELNRLWIDMELESKRDRHGSSWQNVWSRLISSKPRYPRPLGVYLHGGVGCGKTMLMDWLFDEVITNRRKRRCHFNEFMLDFHSRARSQQSSSDVVDSLADDLYEEAQFLCLDEMQVTDIADAVILRRLFSSLFDRGLVLVSTSNRAPSDLYKNGIQRELFLPFISLLDKSCNTISMKKGTDYRYSIADLTVLKGSYAVLSEHEWSENINSALNERFMTLTGTKAPGCSSSLKVSGRKIKIPGASGQVAYFDFSDLCESPLSANDYLTICSNFHTVFVSRVPVVQILSNRNAARRFITFVDCAYDHKVKLILSAKKPRDQIFDLEGFETANAAAPDEVFATTRTVSRLAEMQSKKYMLDSSWVPAKS